MNKILQRLLLFEKFEIKTKLSKQQILDRVKSFADPGYTDYYGSISESGFFIGEKPLKHSTFVHTKNSFAPVVKAKIVEKDGISTVSIVVRMHLLVLILFIPMYVASLFTIVMFPLVLLFLHFTFVKPAERLKREVENLLNGN
ncbi:MAG: hypothetical protein IKC87_05500 [Clostridia bacterium]|nr:hypothetical protein [Clostridia bacterium]